MFEKINLGYTSVFLLLTIFQLGCGTTDEKTRSTQDTSSTNEEPEPQTEIPPDEDPPTNEPNSSLICSPQPNDQMSKLVVDIFDKSMNVETQGCYLEKIETGNEGQIEETQIFEPPTELLCDEENNCEQELGHFAWAWSQSSEYDYESLSPPSSCIRPRRLSLSY